MTMSEAVDPSVGLALTRATAAAKVLGCSVKQRESGAKRLMSGDFWGFGRSREEGGHGTVTGVIKPIHVGCNGPSRLTKEDSASRQRSYRNWAAGGQLSCRYHASLKTAWWQDLTTLEEVSR